MVNDQELFIRNVLRSDRMALDSSFISLGEWGEDTSTSGVGVEVLKQSKEISRFVQLFSKMLSFASVT